MGVPLSFCSVCGGRMSRSRFKLSIAGEVVCPPCSFWSYSLVYFGGAI